MFVTGCQARQSEKSGLSDRTAQNDSVPELSARVVDYANLLTSEQELRLAELLTSLEDSMGSQMVVHTVNTLDGKTIEEYSMNVANHWKIGRKGVDDGILITLALQERMARIEVGYGLELIVRDEIAKRIIDSTMAPHFSGGEYYTGLMSGCEAVSQLIYDNPQWVGKRREPTSVDDR